MFFENVSIRGSFAPNCRSLTCSVILAGAFSAALAGIGTLRAETIGGALVKAYFNNPDINQQRAAVRASDENIPKAMSGYRPTRNG